MSIGFRSIAAMAAFLALCCTARAQSGDELVQMKLIADVASVEPGKPFNVGVSFKIAPKWHLYWINPGDSGEPPRVKWKLPAGFTVSELKFPVPERLTLPGDITSYAYENEVTLVATITPSSDIKPGQSVPIAASATWLVCEKVCLPGEGESKIELPISQKSERANESVFGAIWVPQPIDAKVSADGKPLDLTTGKGETKIRLTTEISGDFEVFPYPLDNVTVTIGDLRRDGKSLFIPIRAAVLPGQKISTKTWKVLVVSRQSGNRVAYDVPVTLITKNTDGDAGASSSSGKH